MNSGLNKNQAIEIDSQKDITREIGAIIEQKFGGQDGDYFVHNEVPREDPKTKQKYRIVLVEQDEKFWQYWFKIV